MKAKESLALLLLLAAPALAAPIQWRPWSDSMFQDAQREKKLVILDLEAIWCHWCHVMDEKTYGNSKVQDLINSHYIAVRVDQDSRPDLSNRYEDYGWPATIIFDSKGRELAKLSGFIEPDDLAGMLDAFRKDPTPGPSAQGAEEKLTAGPTSLTEDFKKSVEKDFLDSYDEKNGGWGFSHKYLDADNLEVAMLRASQGNAAAEKMARRALDENLALIDPTSGGVYQYSTGGRWDEPHFEKIMSFQAGDMRIYSEAYALWKNPADLKAARDIYRFVIADLLSPEGAFYTSKDADSKTIDKHIYARENGWAIEALAALYSVTDDESILKQAKQAAEWISKNRAIPGGGFRHDTKDAAGPYLGDTLAMGRAFLSLYEVSGERVWLSRARNAADFIEKNFQYKSDGFLTSKSTTAGFKPKPQQDENISTVRFFNLLFHYTGVDSYRNIAVHELRPYSSVGVLLGDMELNQDPLHITIVGPKTSAGSKKLYSHARAAYPLHYKRLEIWDRSEGILMNPDVQYPELDKPAAFVCANRRCSLPIFDAQKLQEKLTSKKEKHE